jgi:succinyl-CoA synthetase alpha subunit
MSVLVDKNTRLIVQGFTGKEGTFHAQQAIAYGTKVVGGVTPGKGGTKHLDLPVFDTVEQAVKEDRRQRHRDLRAAAVRRRRHHGSGRRRVPLVVCITEGIPTLDMVKAWQFLQGLARRADRAELPGHHLAGQVQDRHHAGPHHLEGGTWAWFRARAR